MGNFCLAAARVVPALHCGQRVPLARAMNPAHPASAKVRKIPAQHLLKCCQVIKTFVLIFVWGLRERTPEGYDRYLNYVRALENFSLLAKSMCVIPSSTKNLRTAYILLTLHATLKSLLQAWLLLF